MSPHQISLVFCALAVISIPAVYRRFASLESAEPGAEERLRLVQGLACLAIALSVWMKPQWIPAGSSAPKILLAFAGLIGAEIACRVLLRLLAFHLKWKPAFEACMTLAQCGDVLGKFSWVTPHPFLQFTRPRVKLTGGDETIGFQDVKLSDIPKPPGTIRIACLGGSTTEDGYPAMLEEYLNRAREGRRFQVFNFGIGWWSSVHTMLNFVLNVRDFHPDFVVIHDNCNDDKYRGFPGLRGDCAHAYRTMQIPGQADGWLCRFSLLYRIPRIWLGRRSRPEPRIFVGQLCLQERKGNRTFSPRELGIFQRNLETICTLAAAENMRVILLTMPFSNVHRYSEEHDRVYRPHMRRGNQIIRNLARERHALLVDLDSSMTGREEFFWDPVHVTGDGNRLKAREVGNVILSDLDGNSGRPMDPSAAAHGVLHSPAGGTVYVRSSS